MPRFVPRCALPRTNGYNRLQGASAQTRIPGNNVARQKYQVSLIKDIAERDANYIRLLRLLPRLRAWRDLARRPAAEFDAAAAAELRGHSATFLLPGRDGKDISLRIRVSEAFRYTTCLEIVQQPGDPNRIANPGMQVRVYHDVNSAEVLSYQGHRRFKARYRQPDKRMYQVNEKALINRFLGEWLTLCLQCGRMEHGLETALEA